MKTLLRSLLPLGLILAMLCILLLSAPMVSADPPAPGEPTPEYQPPDPDTAPPISEGTDKKKKIADAKKINKPNGTPNLVPYTPSGWSNPIVPAPVTGTTTTGTLTGGKVAYIDYAYKNAGTATASGTIITCLYLDGTEIRRSSVTNLAVNVYGFTKDFAYTVATPGNHTLKIKTDCTNVIAESNENDNVFEKTFYWQGPNLVPYTPSGWSEPIVVSYLKNTSASSALYATLPAYFDYAIKNSGEISSSATIYHCLYLDGTEVTRFSIVGLNAGAWKGHLDWARTVSTTGNHTVKITADCTNVVKELNESDNSWSKTFVWSAADLDTDGDRLLDRWERYGYDHNNDGVIDVDLPNAPFNANYRHKDLYVEADYMTGGGHDHLPDLAHLNDIVAVFNNAPVTNPDGVNGIRIHIDTNGAAFGQAANTNAAFDMNGGTGIAHDNNLGADTVNCASYDWAEFQTLKNANFAANRTRIFHYMIFAHNLSPCYGTTSGISRNGSGDAFALGATDFIVSLGGWANFGSQNAREGTFIHELGHNLGLRHGGNDHTNYKPNYLSVMNYHFQIGGVYRSGAWAHFDYSRSTVNTLNEASLSEVTALGANASGYGTRWYCPNGTVREDLSADAGINWNCDADTTDTAVASDINDDGSRTSLGTQNNWANITFRGNNVIGSMVPSAEANLPMVTTFVDELTFEEQQEMENRLEK